MNYYKIIDNGSIIDVNNVFLRWQEKHRILIGCEAKDAQFIQSSDGAEVYRVPWLNPCPEEAGEFRVIEAVEITEAEYAELRAALDIGEKPAEPIPEPEESPAQPEPAPEPEVMTAAHMRRAIVELQRKNEELEERIAEIVGLSL